MGFLSCNHILRVSQIDPSLRGKLIVVYSWAKFYFSVFYNWLISWRFKLPFQWKFAWKSLYNIVNSTSTPLVFRFEMTWKQTFPRCFNVEYTWYVCRVKLDENFRGCYEDKLCVIVSQPTYCFKQIFHFSTFNCFQHFWLQCR